MNRIKQVIRWCATAGWVCGTVLWIGCKAPEGAYVATAKPESPEAAGQPVVLLNNELRPRLAVDKPVSVRRDSAGRLHVQVGLRNRTNNEVLQVQIQTLFFDDAGHVLYSEVGSEAAWQSVAIAPNQTVYYTQTALTPAAATYTIRVRMTRMP